MRKWDAPEKGRIIVLYLPHQSSAGNGAWNPKVPAKKDKMANTIDELFRVLEK